jgi:type I restriction enzyme R subunit
VNLVFFKLVRSKTKFWQMVGRGTRLCPDLFAPGQNKAFFYLFDYCGNLEYFGQDPATIDAAVANSLSKRLFLARLEMIRELDKANGGARRGVREAGIPSGDASNDAEVRSSLTETLHGEVAAMNLDNFIVRPKRRVVEKFAKPDSWITLSDEDIEALSREVAGLPSDLETEQEEAKRFDLLMLRLQLALMRSEPAFDQLRDQVKAIAGLLEEKTAIPMVMAQMSLIQSVAADEWWQDVTVAMLERVRRHLRALVGLIEKQRRRFIYTDFEDELGTESVIPLPGLTPGQDFEKFRAKAEVFLRSRRDNAAIRRLRSNTPLTASDLKELEHLLGECGGTAGDLERAKKEARGLGLFARSLVGMDREAAKQAMDGFLTGKTLNSNQIQFVNMVVEHLTEHGLLDTALLYGSPFTDIAPRGPDGLFDAGQVTELLAVLERVRETAVAA